MFSFGRVAKTRAHLLADTVEIALAFGDYEQVSKTDVGGIINSSAKDSSDLMNVGQEDLDDNDHPDETGEVEVSDRMQGYIDAAFDQIEYRAAVLGDYYPFLVSGEVVTMKVGISEAAKLYIFLLACSRSRSFGIKGIKQSLANCFEDVSAACLKNMVSKLGVVYQFGPNSDDRKTHFGSLLAEAIPALCKELGMVPSPTWKPPAGASGDAKIDIVGVYGFSDTAQGYTVVVGQCAAMEDEKDWQKKRQEADFETKNGTFHYLTKPAAALFMPVFYRDTNGDWIDADMVSGVIAVDRLRIIQSIFADADTDFTADPFFKRVGLAVAA